MSRAILAQERFFPRKRYLVLFICLLNVCLGVSPYAALAHARPSWQSPGLAVRVEPAVHRVESGQAFIVNVMLDGAVNLGAFQFDVTYDSTVMTVADVELGSFLGSTGRTAQPVGPDIDNVAGLVTFGAFSFGSNAGPEGTGLLAAVTFTAVGSGTSALNLQNVVVTDTMANTQSASVAGGMVTVAVSAPTNTPTMTPRPTAGPTAVPTLVNTATATERAEPANTITPTSITTAAPSETVPRPTIPPVATETATSVIATTSPLAATAAPTDPFTATMVVPPLVTVTGTLASASGTVSSQMSTPALQSFESPLATQAAVESPPASPDPPSSPADVLFNLLVWVLVGGMFLLIAGYTFRTLLRRYRE